MKLFPALHLGWLNGWLFLPFLYLCTAGLAKYGDSYRQFMARVPRHILF